MTYDEAQLRAMQDSDGRIKGVGITGVWFDEAGDIHPDVWRRVVTRRGKSRAAIYHQAMQELRTEWEREQVEAMKARLRTRARIWFRIKSLFTFWRTL